MDRKTRYLADFSLAALFVLAANMVTISAIDAAHKIDPRTLSLSLVSNKIRNFVPDQRFALAIFGDSRSQPLDGQDFCSILPAGSEDCVNVSSTSGDWLTAYMLFEKLRPNLEDGAPLLIFVSDYWLESPTLGVIHKTNAYYELDEMLLGIESNLRLSALRSTRMDWLHERLAGLAKALEEALTGAPAPAGKKATRAALHKVFRSNADRWFAPIDDDTRARSERIGHKVLKHMKSAGQSVTLVYLPNLERRDEYVDLHYPGRRDRFHSTLRALATANDIRLLDLSDTLIDREFFKDFHHLNTQGRERVSRILARDLIGAGVIEGPSPTNPHQ